MFLQMLPVSLPAKQPLANQPLANQPLANQPLAKQPVCLPVVSQLANHLGRQPRQSLAHLCSEKTLLTKHTKHHHPSKQLLRKHMHVEPIQTAQGNRETEAVLPNSLSLFLSLSSLSLSLSLSLCPVCLHGKHMQKAEHGTFMLASRTPVGPFFLACLIDIFSHQHSWTCSVSAHLLHFFVMSPMQQRIHTKSHLRQQHRQHIYDE